MTQRTPLLQQRTMKAVVNTRHGSVEVLRLEDRPAPSPSAGEVRIRVAAAGLNPSEVNARQGMYPDAPPPPRSSSSAS